MATTTERTFFSHISLRRRTLRQSKLLNRFSSSSYLSDETHGRYFDLLVSLLRNPDRSIYCSYLDCISDSISLGFCSLYHSPSLVLFRVLEIYNKDFEVSSDFDFFFFLLFNSNCLGSLKVLLIAVNLVQRL